MTANSHTNSEPKKVTLSDVAKEAKVSPITVARAFSSPDLVKPQTRDLVFKVAAKLNYSPNAFARNLKTNSSPIIGVVTDSTYNPVYAQVVKTLYEEADKSGYIIIMFETAGNAARESGKAKSVLLKRDLCADAGQRYCLKNRLKRLPARVAKNKMR